MCIFLINWKRGRERRKVEGGAMAVTAIYFSPRAICFDRVEASAAGARTCHQLIHWSLGAKKVRLPERLIEFCGGWKARTDHFLPWKRGEPTLGVTMIILIPDHFNEHLSSLSFRTYTQWSKDGSLDWMAAPSWAHNASSSWMQVGMIDGCFNYAPMQRKKENTE